MVHYVDIDNSLRSDLDAAAQASGMSVPDFEKWSITAAIQEYRRHTRGWSDLEDAIGVIPGGD